MTAFKDGARAIPDCLGPHSEISAPRFEVPDGAWDTHFHILGPQQQFPYASDRKYTPPDASIAGYRRLQRALGLRAGMVVHANTHGFDNSVDLDAVAQLGRDAFFAVARVDHSICVEQLARWNDQGVRGIRFAFNPNHGGGLDKALFEKVAGLIRPYAWFMELHMAADDLVNLKPWLSSLNIRLVIDHIGRVDVSLGTEQAPFQALIDLVKTADVWVKLSGADRISRLGAPYTDVVPFAKMLMEIAPDRMLWGSDWPHTGYFDAARMPDDGVLLNLLMEYAPSEALRRMILVDNPRRLAGLT